MKIYTSILLILVSSVLDAQKSNRLVPVIDSVTVINNQTFISWSFEDDPGYQLSGFKIYKAFGDSETDFAPLIDVDSLTYTFTDITSAPDEKKERYKIAAYSAALDSLSPTSNFHQSLFLQIEYDSCTRNNLIAWNPYLNWRNGVDHYQLYVQRENGSFEDWPVPFQDTFFFHNSHDVNTNYTYFVRAYGNDGESSTSNFASVYTNVPVDPAFLDFYTASVVDVNQLNLRFSIDGNADVIEYNLWRSDNYDTGYQSLAIYNHNPETPHLEYTDNIITSRYINYYYVTAINTCNYTVWTTDTINNMLLHVDTTNQYNNQLSWNKTSKHANEYYRIYRSNDGVNFDYLDEVNTLLYNDNYLQSNFTTQGNICYYVEAISNNPNITAINKSNIECLEKKPEINLPTVFSPNGDGKNDTFKPNISFSTNNNYKFVIMNRWGEILFETSDTNDAWDGTFKDKKVQQGTYIYYLQFNDSQGKIVENSGSITVYYP